MSVQGAVVALLIGSALIAPAPPAPTWVPGEHGGPTVRLSVENWGEETDLSTSAHAYARLGADGPATHITVTIEPPSSGMHGYYGRLTAPDAFGGEVIRYCGEEYMRIDSWVRCGFDIPISSGVNHLTFDLQSASWEGIVSKEGTIYGGRVGVVSVLEASLPYGNWALVPSDGALQLRGEQTSALRYRIMNTGDLPFRVPDSCQPNGTVWPYQQLLCAVRSPRPVYALAGDYALPIDLLDPVGGGASFTIDGTLAVTGIRVGPNRAR